MKKVIIIGATSGIGSELAKIFSNQGYEVGILGRRERLLAELSKELPNKAYPRHIDVSLPNEAIDKLNNLIEEMSGADIIVISSGVGYFNTDLEWTVEEKTISTNVCGFAAMCNAAMNFFIRQGHGLGHEDFSSMCYKKI
jgi:short-subunit dehydrogenase